MGEETFKKIKEILKKYDIPGSCIHVEENHNGNINSTYVVTMQNETEERRYIIQKINTNVFPRPSLLMRNIENVTRHLERELMFTQDGKHHALHLRKTKDNKTYCYVLDDGDRDYYRIFDYIENAKTYNTIENAEVAFKIGQAFGNFQKMLRNFPMSELEETIPDFHATDKRYAQLEKDIIIDSENRASEVTREFMMIFQNKNSYSHITSALKNGIIPLRVTHNDTKVNNVMVDALTDEFIAVIDLDTVMPGSMLFDYGDGIRSSATTAFENEVDLSKVHLDIELFKAYTDGYLSEMASCITPEEVALMGESIKIITLELAIRFLDDYVCGDTYFKVDLNRPKHNLERCQNQLALAKDIENKMPLIEEFIQECYNKYRGQNLERKLNSH